MTHQEEIERDGGDEEADGFAGGGSGAGGCATGEEEAGEVVESFRADQKFLIGAAGVSRRPRFVFCAMKR